MKKRTKKSKKNEKTKMITLLLMLLIIAAITLDVYLNFDNGGHVKTLQKYMSYIESGKYGEMYEMLTDESKNKISKEEFITRNKNIYEGIEAKNIKIANITVNKEKNNVSYRTTMETIAGKLSFNNTISIIDTGEKDYRVNWNSNAIFPELQDNYKVKIGVIKAKRGKILDRNGEVLAEDGKASAVGLVPGKMAENKESDIIKIANLLDVEADFIHSQLSQRYVNNDTFVPIKTIKKNEKELKEKLLKIRGVMISDKDVRIYPYEEATSHMLGYIQTISTSEFEKYKNKGYTEESSIGKSGLELAYEDILHETDGHEIYIENENGGKLKTLTETKQEDGKDVKLTIDANIQKLIYEQFKEDKSVTVAMKPKTGEILALVSTPSFNSNDFSLGMPNEKWENLKSNPANPLFNRYTATFVPGSSFKPILGAIGLSEDELTAEEDFGQSGKSWQKDNSWNDFKITTLDTYDGPANLQNALIYSDNIYFAKAALRIGTNTIEKYAKKMGFGEKIDFVQELGVSKISNNGRIDSDRQLASTGYGQGELLINPIFMASIYSAFLNDGNMIKPYLEYRDKSDIEYLKENIFTKEAADIIKEDLIQVVENPEGTGHRAKIENVKIGGKTGTAEIKDNQNDDNGTEIGWFNYFIDSENFEKKLLMVTLVEDVKDKDGSHYVVTKVRDMLVGMV